MPSQNPLAEFSGSMSLKTVEYYPENVPPPTSLFINMTMLDKIERRAQGFREIVLNVDSKMHRYKTEDVLRILRQIELD